MELSLNPITRVLEGRVENLEFRVSDDNLRSVYYRAPVFLRDSYQPDLALDDQFARSQWAAFLRAFTVFERASWMNHPRATYQAEIKPYQLAAAAACSLIPPSTVVTNQTKALPGSRHLATKTLDTVVLRDGEQEGFIYTQVTPREEVENSSLSSAPVIVQQGLVDKLDVRVTIIDQNVVATAITSKTGGTLDGDWRVQKDNVDYHLLQLPAAVEKGCRDLVRLLELRFAGVDLARCGDTYYFIEANPTGEWAWLMGATGAPLDEMIASALMTPPAASDGSD
jgi:hypothetical protein